MNTAEHNKKQLAKIVAHAWVDPAFKDQLVAHPEDIFRTEGIEIPEDIKLNVVEDTPQRVNLVLSNKPRVQTSTGADNDLYTVLAIAYDKALADPEFAAKLTADPTGTVRGLGAELPDGLEIIVHRDTDGARFFALPLPPKARVRVEVRGSAGIGIEEGGPAPASMLLKHHPDPKPTNTNVNVNATVQVNAAANVNVAANAVAAVNAAATVNAAAAATVTVVAAAIVLI
jgi:hypothetical protein